MSKYVFFTGGVVSGLGKGITAMSLGKLMKARGYSIEVVKFNPYFNIDSSNLCPEAYGETYITNDGRACDLVMGHYERILDESITARNDITSGEIYNLVIEKERENFFSGQTVQVVPHITDEIKRCIIRVGGNADIVLVELGGTVGDIETQPYMEAIRQLKANLGKTNVAYVHVSLVPYIDVSGEQKTKPTQHSVKELQNLGIQPDVIVCRSDFSLGASSRNKLSLFCNVEKDCIIESIVTPNIYEIPLMLEKEGFCNVVLRKLKLENHKADLSDLESFCYNIKRIEREENCVRIGLVDKNADKIDVNMSLSHALLISGVDIGKRVEIVPIKVDTESKTAEPAFKKQLADLHGIIISHDVSDVALSGKKAAIEFARETNIPAIILGDAAYLGLNLGSKDVFKAKKAKYGLHKIEFLNDDLFISLYGKNAEQRFKSKMYVPKEIFNGLNLKLSGTTADNAVCAYRDENHRFFAGVFFRPEFSARPGKPSPIISAFLQASAEHIK